MALGKRFTFNLAARHSNTTATLCGSGARRLRRFNEPRPKALSGAAKLAFAFNREAA
jgi:hypothetical protein